MKRLWGILLLLVAGAILNVLVAWGIAVSFDFENVVTESIPFRMSDSYARYEQNDRAVDIFEIVIQKRFGSQKISSHAGSYVVGMDPETNVEIEIPAFDVDEIPFWIHETIKTDGKEIMWSVGHGWPFIAIVSDQERIQTWIRRATFTTSGPEQIQEVQNGFVLNHIPWPDGNPRVLPLRPAWWGFLLNTLFYAGQLWLPFAARRVIRRKRGRCSACGYDLRGNVKGGCPECGWGRERATP